MLWGILGGLAFVALVVVWVITVSDMVRRHLGRGKTAAWLVIVILLPFAGSILYWVLRQPTAEEIQRQADNELALRQEAQRHGIDSTGLRP
jgi:cbb3-type cytochrome oxidase subunit 3